RVDNQWWDDRVESHDRRHADDPGIGHSLRHDNRPYCEAGQDIRHQPIAPVGREPIEDGQQLLCDRGKTGRDRHNWRIPDESGVKNLKIRTSLGAIANFGFKGTLKSFELGATFGFRGWSPESGDSC